MSFNEGILGQEYWRSVKKKQLEYASPDNRQWSIDIRPAILRTRSWSKSSTQQLRSTAWLDGLRGFAALMVYFGHHQLWAHDYLGQPENIFENAFGYNRQKYFATFPFMRMFFSGGHFAVSVFFVMSGYVLSHRPMQLIHIGDHAKLGENVASALFRRWLRLFIPVACVTFLYMASLHLGVVTEVEKLPTFREELWRWHKEFRDYSFVFDTSGKSGTTYSLHIWSIPVEMKGSIVVYTSLLAFSRLSRNARLLCPIGLIIYFLYFVDGWYLAMFVMGMLQCDISLLEMDNNLPTPLARLAKLRQPFFWLLLVVGIWLGGCPAASQDVNVLRESPGWYYLSFLKPEATYDYKWFFLFCAAGLTIASTARLPILKRFFENRFNQYLGRIAFGLYLVHGPVLWTVADRIYAATGCTKASHGLTAARWMNKAQLPRAGPLGLEVNFVIPQILILPITLWVAEIVTRLFDEPSVRFAHWLYRRCLPTLMEKPWVKAQDYETSIPTLR